MTIAVAAGPAQVQPIQPQTAPVQAPNGVADLEQKLLKTWKKFGWTSAPLDLAKNNHATHPLRDLTSLLVQHPDCVQFLRESGLLYTIRGYQHTIDKTQGPVDFAMRNLQQGIKLAEDGHPLLLKEGLWVRWETLKNIVRYDADKKEIVSIANPDQEWNYFYPDGLSQISRFNEIYPIYQLTDGEMQTLQNHGEQYFEQGVPQELEESRGNWHYMQVFTSHNSAFSKLSHVGLRLIPSSGEVYSLGYETPSGEIPFTEQHFVGTYNASIASLDYDEFKPYKARRVTTIPLTQAQYDAAFNKIRDYSERPLRFNRLHQNCATYVVDIMKEAGHQVDITCTLIDGLPSLAPRIKDIPCIGPIFDKIRKCVSAALAWIVANIVPSFIVRAVNTVAAAVFAVVKKVFSIITNIFALIFGATKGSAPVDAENKSIYNRDGLHYFDRLIEKPIDVLKNEPATIYTPTKLVEWQLDQRSTYIHKHDGSPQFCILPTENN